MIPLTTLQGLAPQDLRDKIAGRPVMIWGAGDVAQDVATSLRKSDIAVAVHLDSRDPDLETHLAQKPFVVLATVSYRKQAEEILAKAECDFITHLSIRRPMAVIEIASPERFMSVDDFRRVAAKLDRDLPQLVRIALSYLHDPRTHPHLDELVAIAENVAPVTLDPHAGSENLYLMPYDRLLQDAPDVAEAARALPYDLAKARGLALADKALPCLSQRVFPVITTGLEVAVCHLYKPLILHENYLEADWARLLQTREATSHCEACQAKGLHRFDIAVLGRRHKGAL